MVGLVRGRGPLVAEPRPLRVVEIGNGVAGAVCGRLFAALGHDVVRCELPGADRFRTLPPLDASGRSLAFTALHAGKSSVEVPAGERRRHVVDELVAGADVVVVDLLSEESAELGLDEQAAEDHSDVVVVRITGFGIEGPRADLPSDSLLAEAFGGLATMIGDAHGRPLALGGEQAAYGAGVTGFMGAVLALMRRDAGAGGDLVDVALCDVVAYMDWKSDISLAMTGRSPKRSGIAPGDWRLVRVRDGWVGFIFQSKHWPAVVEMVGAPELAEPALADDATRAARSVEWWPVLEEWARLLGAEEVYEVAQAHGLPFGWVTRPSDLLRSAQLRHRGFILPDSDGAWDEPVVGSPVRCTLLPWHRGRAPMPGASTAARAPLTLGRRRVPSEVPPAAPAGGPLGGVVVLDFGTITAGAAVTRLLADFGATVLKVEWLDHPDTFRSWKMPVQPGADPATAPTSPYFASNNLGKMGVAVNLKSDEGRALVHRLARQAHVVVENYRVGVTRRLGIDADTLLGVNPNLLYVSLSSQGQDGPEAANSSYGSTLDLLSGLAGVTGYDADHPLWSSSDVNYPDQLVSLFCAAFVIYSLREGVTGAHLDISQREVVSWTLAAELADALFNGHDAVPTGNHRPGRVPHETYPCLGADHWVAVSCSADAERRALAECITAPGLRHRAEAWWRANEASVDATVAAWTGRRSRQDVLDALHGAGVPAVAVLDAAGRAEEPHFAERQVTVRRAGQPTKGLPMTFLRYRPPVPPDSPGLGAHTRQVLRANGGLSDEEIDDLDARGVIYCNSEDGRDRPRHEIDLTNENPTNDMEHVRP